MRLNEHALFMWPRSCNATMCTHWFVWAWLARSVTLHGAEVWAAYKKELDKCDAMARTVLNETAEGMTGGAVVCRSTCCTAAA